MAHEQQVRFCEIVKSKFPQYFHDVDVLDCGSLDINGNNRYLFNFVNYTGIDLVEGKNVDIVGNIKDIDLDNGDWEEAFDVVISTEMLEHCYDWRMCLFKMYHMIIPNGLLLFTCATEGRSPHGIPSCRPEDSPLTNDYYNNLTESDIRSVLDVDKLFSNYEFQVNDQTHDLYFWGIKN